MKGIKGFQKGPDNPAWGVKPHNFGKHPSKATLEKLSKSHLGHKMPKEQRDRLSRALKGRKKPPRTKEHRKKIGDSRRGELNYRWIDGRSKLDKPYPSDWTESLRDSIRMRDSYICQECGVHQDELSFGQVKKLDVHHIDYNKDNLNCDNLISLCRGCHVKTNIDRDYWINYFKKI